jgi:transposase
MRAIAQLPTKVDVRLQPPPPRKEGRKPLHDKTAGVDRREEPYKKFGVDLTCVEGIGVLIGMVLPTEVVPNLSRFPNAKHFCSWLGLCPDNRISGGKVLSSRMRRVINQATDALRLATTTLERS